MNFDNMTHARIYITDSFFFDINDTLIAIWVIGAVLIALAVIARIKIKKFKDVPDTKFQNIIEAIVESFDNYSTGILTKQYSWLANWFFGLFLFFIVSNVIGITGVLRPPTADLALTFAMGFTTVILMQVVGFKYNGINHVKDWMKPFFLFAPLNIIGDLTKSISLSMRLFGNMISGLILMGLIYGMLPWFAGIGLPAGLSMFFDIFVGLLQAFIFVTVSMFFIMTKTPQTD